MSLTNAGLGCLPPGLNFLLSGLGCRPRLSAFRAHLVQQFAATPLPPALVGLFGTVLPVVEGTLGLLLLRLFTRPALGLMSLVFGSRLLENQPLVGDQLLYGLFALALLAHLPHNRCWCLDVAGSAKSV